MPQEHCIRVTKGEVRAKTLVVFLVSQSAWFTLTPLPDDEWEFTVKPEHADAFDAFYAANRVSISNEGGPLELWSYHDREQTPEAAALRDRADEEHGRDGECEIDENAVVSENDDNGAYVLGWLFVYYTKEERIERGLNVEDTEE